MHPKRDATGQLMHIGARIDSAWHMVCSGEYIQILLVYVTRGVQVVYKSFKGQPSTYADKHKEFPL